MLGWLAGLEAVELGLDACWVVGLEAGLAEGCVVGLEAGLAEGCVVGLVAGLDSGSVLGLVLGFVVGLETDWFPVEGLLSGLVTGRPEVL
ncbi:MAG: hypothetical protein U5K51_13315 [Flavobacteriaceae bacterium]|nr:hypothetical protein [Flavobacteriaceae bacterium]